MGLRSMKGILILIVLLCDLSGAACRERPQPTLELDLLNTLVRALTQDRLATLRPGPAISTVLPDNLVLRPSVISQLIARSIP